MKTARKPKRARKPVDRHFGEWRLSAYDDATYEHLGWIGRPLKENDISLLDAKRMHKWLGLVIEWIEYRERKGI